jgi:hypothetical protein
MALTVATLLEKCSKSNRISQILKKFACGGQFSILSSELNGFHSCYIAGKVLQIRPNIANPQKNRLRRAVQGSPQQQGLRPQHLSIFMDFG